MSTTAIIVSLVLIGCALLAILGLVLGFINRFEKYKEAESARNQVQWVYPASSRRTVRVAQRATQAAVPQGVSGGLQRSPSVESSRSTYSKVPTPVPVAPRSFFLNRFGEMEDLPPDPKTNSYGELRDDY